MSSPLISGSRPFHLVNRGESAAEPFSGQEKFKLPPLPHTHQCRLGLARSVDGDNLCVLRLAVCMPICTGPLLCCNPLWLTPSYRTLPVPPFSHPPGYMPYLGAALPEDCLLYTS